MDYEYDDDEKTVCGDEGSTDSDFGTPENMPVTDDETKAICGDEPPDSGLGSNESIEKIVDAEGFPHCANNGLLEEIEMDDYIIPLTISLDSGINLSRSFSSSSTVSDVIKSVETENFDDYDLEWNGQFLPRSITLRDGYVSKNSVFKLIERKIKVTVEVGNGRKYAVETRPSATVKSLKKELCDVTQVAANAQRFSFNGHGLNDTKTLREYEIKNNSKLLMCYECYGG